jgi:hypothetical protein
MQSAMKKRIFFILLFSAGSLSLFSQSVQHEKKEETDSIEHRVMLIPYDPRFYLSDADKEIAEQSKKSPEQIRRTIHRTSEWYVYREIRKRYPVISLLENDTIESYIEAAGSIFSNAAYAYAHPLVAHPVPKINVKDPNKDAADSRIASRYLNDDSRVEFMNANVNKKEVFQKLSLQFNADLFVMLTQFEFKTNYKTCLDIANKIYQREIKLHFTIYDKTGKLVGGNYAVAFIPSNVNNLDEIIKSCFPLLAEGVTASF